MMILPEIARKDFEKYKEKRRELADLLGFEGTTDDEVILALAISDSWLEISERGEVYKRIVKSREERKV